MLQIGPRPFATMSQNPKCWMLMVKPEAYSETEEVVVVYTGDTF